MTERDTLERRLLETTDTIETILIRGQLRKLDERIAEQEGA